MRVGGLDAAAEPHRRCAPAITHHASAKMSVAVSSCAAATSDRHDGERRALAGGQQHRRLEEVRVAHSCLASCSSRSTKPSGPRPPGRPRRDRGRALAERRRRRPLAPGRRVRRSCAQRAERVQVGRVVAAVQRAVDARGRASAAATAVPLSTSTGGPDLEHLAAPVRDRPCACAAAATRSSAAAGRLPRPPRRGSGTTQIASLSSSVTPRRSQLGAEALLRQTRRRARASGAHRRVDRRPRSRAGRRAPRGRGCRRR